MIEIEGSGEDRKMNVIVFIKPSSPSVNVDNIILEKIVVDFKDRFLMAIKDLFGGSDTSNVNVERSSVKIYLEISKIEQLEDLLGRLKDGTQCKEIFSTVREIEFDGSKFSFNPEHFTASLYTADGLLIDYSNYQNYFPQFQEERKEV